MQRDIDESDLPPERQPDAPFGVEAPTDLDLAGVDAAIASQLARIVDHARTDAEEPGHETELLVLRTELERVAEQLESGSLPERRRWSFGSGPAATSSSLAGQSRWSASTFVLPVLATMAAASLTLAVLPIVTGDTAETKTITMPVPGRPGAASPVTAKIVPRSGSHAETARDASRAARFRSARSDAMSYTSSSNLHLAAQRKEVEADLALAKGNHALAVVLYDMARSGYEDSTSRAEMAAGEIEKARIDAQVAADAQRVDASASYPATNVLAPQPGYGPIRPLILTPPAAVEPQPRAAFAAVFTEPSDGARRGGTWGACWRSTIDSAKACARANCEGSRTSNRPCVEVASSRPGEHCVVARATGYGVSSGACGPRRADAEASALAQCRNQLATQYGPVPSGCGIAWSTDR